MKEWVIRSHFLVGELPAWTSFLLGKAEFSLVPQTLETSSEECDHWLLSPQHTHHQSITQSFDVLMWAAGQRPPFKKSSPCLLTREREGGGQRLPITPPPAIATPTSSWNFTNTGIFAAAFHQCHLSGFRIIILLKCFRCHISNP